MKKCLQNIGLLMVLALYCFAVSLYSGIAIVNTDAFSKPVSSQQQTCKKGFAAGCFFHTTQSKISGAVYNAGRPAPVKNTHNEIIAGSIAAEQLFSHRFCQYNFYSKNLMIRLQKTALIFPFHYFW